MKRIDDNTIALTQEEVDTLRDFIRTELRYQWDQYTEVYICTDSAEDGMRRMAPELYDMANEMGTV